MSDYILSRCSTADLTKEHFEKRDIKYIYSHYQLDGVPYPDDLGQTMPFDKFYQAMADGADTKTSQINADEFEEFFEPFLKEGKDILHVCLSSGITGVVNSANIAKSVLEEKYPERTIYIVDALTASSGYGLLVDTMADLGACLDTVGYIHIKDKAAGRQEWSFPALGQGYVPFPGIFRMLDENDNLSPFSIEIEFTAAGAKDLDEINQAVLDSAEYLRGQGFEF